MTQKSNMSLALSAVAIKKYAYVNTIAVSTLEYISLELSIIYNGMFTRKNDERVIQDSYTNNLIDIYRYRLRFIK